LPPGALGGHLAGSQDLAGKDFMPILAQLGNAPEFATILVTERERIEGILDGDDVEAGKRFSETRPTPRRWATGVASSWRV